jgi:hypothetical protein
VSSVLRRSRSSLVNQLVERKTPHLALSAGGAFDASLLRIGGRTLGSTASTLGACIGLQTELRLRISFRDDAYPRFEPTDRRARGRGELADASASVAVGAVEE